MTDEFSLAMPDRDTLEAEARQAIGALYAEIETAQQLAAQHGSDSDLARALARATEVTSQISAGTAAVIELGYAAAAAAVELHRQREELLGEVSDLGAQVNDLLEERDAAFSNGYESGADEGFNDGIEYTLDNVADDVEQAISLASTAIAVEVNAIAIQLASTGQGERATMLRHFAEQIIGEMAQLLEQVEDAATWLKQYRPGIHTNVTHQDEEDYEEAV